LFHTTPLGIRTEREEKRKREREKPEKNER
jgi:hypothetical protein